MKKDPREVVNLYDDPNHADVVVQLKDRLAKLRRRIGDTGEDYPEVEAIIQEFWNDDAADRARAAEISRAYLRSKEKGGRR